MYMESTSEIVWQLRKADSKFDRYHLLEYCEGMIHAGKQVDESNAFFFNKYNRSVRTIQNWLDILETEGLITRIKNDG